MGRYGAQGRNRTGEPLPYQGSALPTELLGLISKRSQAGIGAGDEDRTRDIQLGRLELYQLSYSRLFFLPAFRTSCESRRIPRRAQYGPTLFPPARTWKRLVVGGGFEPPKAAPTDLQSVPFGHSGTPPKRSTWSQRRDLNPRPADYKSAALPAELRWLGRLVFRWPRLSPRCFPYNLRSRRPFFRLAGTIRKHTSRIRIFQAQNGLFFPARNFFRPGNKICRFGPGKSFITSILPAMQYPFQLFPWPAGHGGRARRPGLRVSLSLWQPPHSFLRPKRPNATFPLTRDGILAT